MGGRVGYEVYLTYIVALAFPKLLHAGLASFDYKLVYSLLQRSQIEIIVQNCLIGFHVSVFDD